MTDWQYVTLTFSLVAITLSVIALGHLLTHQRDHRSAAFWVAIIVLSPFLGACLYGLLGINFIRRRGQQYRGGIGPAYRDPVPTCPLFVHGDAERSERDGSLAVTLDRISRFNFSSGNSIVPFINGDEAMPAMIAAIREAKSSVALSSYIFEATGIGAEFVDALDAACKRGVQVRVIVDDAGTRYSWPPVTKVLSERGVPVERFMPNRFILRLLTMNLRNHKKVLVVDGCIAFTGGMNIREGNMLARHPGHPVQDLQFKLTGPVVTQIQRVFAEDWIFCSGEALDEKLWFPEIAPTGNVHGLGIVDGPDEDYEVMPTALFAALSAARHQVCIVTPYFLPPVTLLAALKLCATRGVDVTIITPAKNNIPFVAWAARTLYGELLHAGCRIYESPAPFDHSKLLLIDDAWSILGSTNWDPRSLRLNFEFNVACHNTALVTRLKAIVDQKKAISAEITEAMLENLPLKEQLRNGFARLFIPVL
ncbi:phospholipase D-like domain-containing protein [Brevifollis gellanilyticus]|nr:phospholipase D-like domain-containing protein [Brevifollis gellanilyticus]